MRLIIFILGLAIGGYAVYKYDQRQYATTGLGSDVGSTRDATAERLQQWHLTPDDIRSDLSRTGQVVRENSKAVGAKLDDARIVAVIKSKYVLDKDLSALDIHVACADGYVTLTGSVASEGMIGKAVVLALDTGGVRNVTAKLTTR